ncbi:MAG TPA: universal stress protein [Solirubrobacteraceae bacterium]|jgi:nucleotide-binding universal stress UspA family protein|nr:universal stress protein [Solirubrobacteraceae bacterium]
MPGSAPILIAYDGSSAAREAVEQAGVLFAPRTATIVTVWEPGLSEFMLVPDATGMGTTMLPYDPAVVREVDRLGEDHAKDIAHDGASLAQKVGLQAEAVVVRDTADTAAAIVAAAKERDVGAIVIGSRGLKGLRSKLLGSTSSEVLRKAGRPVMVVRHPDDQRHD